MLDGRLLNERYRIKGSIGGGGMADVYLARDTILDRDVAIKVLRLDYADDEEFIARFDREAQSAASLSHPNIVSVYDVGEEDRILFMAMEYVDGMTLKEYIQRYAPLDVGVALDIMKQIASAIAHAHANDIIHRDIKPQNIMIDTYGQAKVTDFGIAMALSSTALTQTNSILGSVHYLSPEQARGGTATKKSDIYSLGIVLFELLTGRLPFSGQSPVSIALMHLQSDTPSVKRYNPDIPQSVENVVLKATAKAPFHRYDSVYDMEDGLETALDPDRLDEEKFVPPAEEGEETKAIPIITDDQTDENPNGDTIVSQPNENGNTKAHTAKGKAQDVKKGKKGKKGKKKKPGRKKWLILSGVLLILLAAGIAALLIPGLFQPKDVDVPDVSGLEYEEALADLQELNLDTEREEAYSDEVDEGVVIQTDPEAGSTVQEEDTVTIVVSQGKEAVAFEDYTGQNFDQVKRILENKGFKDITANDAYSGDYNTGEVMNHVYPSPGTEVIPDEAEVIFEVSKGPEPISLNNLTGMAEQEAINSLENQGLNASISEENSDSTPEGEVIRQEPEAGAEMAEGDTVNVYISTGPEEKPPLNHEETFTVSYNPPQESDDSDEPVEQTVKIYIGDNNRSISEVYDEYTITEDREFTIPLTIAPDSVADYRVIRDDEVVIDKSIPYEKVEGE
ncbi:Stk1 family PASTA domain-containing Ser/Thr kinase [Lentibacillus salicampi]|uniref:Serine/threonine-protein kinase PrkC n=1 Tax=Lentibacillus salicampi TaxID=175306 RepID=A0A4Y9AGR8_9BACI|nr:Stk1 family PASTA domain-containing Ser/Thr kinase [Lentibacillus salicampi]TFJ94605.1 Stk1 family PASTA domain-containing Ser/Thr kinase [Lentibacillus salicampi]